MHLEQGLRSLVRGAQDLSPHPGPGGAKHGLVRVIDEMGEDYLFPEEYFVPLRLPQAAERAMLRAGS